MKKYNKQISFGYDVNGNRIRKWFHADTKGELEYQIEEYKAELRKVANPSDITFKDYSTHWKETYKVNRAKQTLDMYDNALNKCAQLDPYQIRKITKSMCQKVINESWEFPSAAKVLSSTMKQIFKSAMADGIIATNPAEMLTLPKKPKSKFYLLTQKDLEKIAKADLSDQDRLFVTILQVFGLRPAEALALQPMDFDFRKRVLHITKSLELTNDNRSNIKSTKTGVSRDIPIPEELTASLEASARSNKRVFLFTKADGNLYTKSAYRRLSERILKACGLPAQATLYSFRHRRATDLYYLTQSGEISCKLASELLGHSEIVFLNTYSHVDKEMESKNIYKNFSFAAVTNL